MRHDTEASHHFIWPGPNTTSERNLTGPHETWLIWCAH